MILGRESRRPDRLHYALPSGLGSVKAVGSARGWVRFQAEKEGPFSTGLDSGRGAANRTVLC